MRVSVIIPTYNRAHLISNAIDSILAQTFNDFELIIVDNFSSDDTESVVKSYVDRRIRYFKNNNNGLVSINRNYGIENSRGEYIAFLDDDDSWLPKKLEKQVSLLESNNELGLVYSDCYVIDDNDNIRENTYCYGRKLAKGKAFNELFQSNFIPMLTVVIRKEALDKVGGFNPRYKIAEDYDLWLRIAAHYPIDFTDQPLAKFRVHSQSSYQTNTVLSYREDLQIVDYWLNKDPELKKGSGRKIRAQKYRAVLLMAIGRIYRSKSLKSVRELGGLLKYILSPKH
ncbi:glycosyltransferase [Chloroflexota bacterium]